MSGTATSTIIQALNETSEGPKRLIGEIVSTLGEREALELLEETKAIESSGGQMIKKGTRRRTPGGVFFRLAKRKMSPEQRRTVFRVLEPQKKPKPKPKPPPAAPKAQASPRPATPASARGVLPRSDRESAARDLSPPGPLRRRRIIEVAPPPPPPPRPPPPASKGAKPAPTRRRIVTAADKLVKLPHPVSPVKVVQDDRVARGEGSDADTARSRVQAILDTLEPQQASRLLVELALERSGARGEAARRRVEATLDELAPLPRQPEPEPAPEPEPVEAPDLDELRAQVLARVTGALGLTESALARALYDDESSEAKRRASKLLRKVRNESR